MALSVVSMPDGFSGFFKSGSYEVSKVHASGDGADTIATFQATVPSEATDGVYEIVLHAASDTGYEENLTIELTVSGLEAGRAISMWNIRIRRASRALLFPIPPPLPTIH